MRAAVPDARLGKNTDFPSTRAEGSPSDKRELRNRRLRTARKVVPDTRMAQCMWAIAHERSVQVVLSDDGKAGYAGVTRCGLRACPWCASIEAGQDFRRAARVTQSWVDEGYMLVMASFTMRHHADEKLEVLRKALVDAQDFLHRGRPWRRFAEENGFLKDRFYGNEVTDGVNGWHLHRHMVYALSMPRWGADRASRKRFARKLKRELTRLWLHALEKYGRTVRWDRAELKRAVVVSVAAGDAEDPDAVARYVTKFALEATYSVAKQGRYGNKSPWELLDEASDHTLTAAQRSRARARFREFVTATRGMHWTWFSEGCAAGPNEDEAPWSDDPGRPVLDVSPFEWRCLRLENRQIWLLQLVELLGAEAARAELRRFTDLQRWSKRFRWRESLEEVPGGEYMDAVAF